jgi:hypothetical protein
MHAMHHGDERKQRALLHKHVAPKALCLGKYLLSEKNSVQNAKFCNPKSHTSSHGWL